MGAVDMARVYTVSVLLSGVSRPPCAALPASAGPAPLPGAVGSEGTSPRHRCHVCLSTVGTLIHGDFLPAGLGGPSFHRGPQGAGGFELPRPHGLSKQLLAARMTPARPKRRRGHGTSHGGPMSHRAHPVGGSTGSQRNALSAARSPRQPRSRPVWWPKPPSGHEHSRSSRGLSPTARTRQGWREALGAHADPLPGIRVVV